MRKIVLHMMTTLNGRLDDPMVWLSGVSDDQYRDIDRIYAGYDTVLVGRVTYEEMAAYWPGAVSEGTEANRSMARRMGANRKLVFSRSGREKPSAWNNAEQVVAGNDGKLAEYLAKLKGEPGRDITLSGGASFAQAVVALGLVDEYRFFVYPVVSQGETWFARLPDKRALKLIDSTAYENGVVQVHYAPEDVVERARPASFTDMLT